MSAVRRSRRDVGRDAHERGEDFEAWVERHHREALRLGVVAGPVEHNEPHAKMIRGEWTMVKPGVADYTGVLYDSHGSTLAVEAKSRRAVLYKSDVEPRQQAHLDVVVRGGGLALLLVRLWDADPAYQREYAVPWRDVPWRVRRSAESVVCEDLEPWLVLSDRACYLVPYCPVRGTPVAVASRRFPRE